MRPRLNKCEMLTPKFYHCVSYLGEMGVVGEEIGEMTVVDMIPGEDSEEEDDDVHDTAAHIDMGQVEKLAVQRLTTLISSQTRIL